MLKRIKCCGIKKSEWRLFVRDKLIILFIIKLYNLFFDLFWKNKVIGIGKGHDVMYRFMYVSTTLYVSNRIEATLYYLYVGIVRLGPSQALILGLWWNAIFVMFNKLSGEHS